MREIDADMLINVSGAGGDQTDKNQQLLNSLGSSMAWGAGLGAVGGPGGAVAGAITGAAGAALQTVVDGAVAHGPVNVPIPVVPMGPTWNGSGGGAGVSPCAMDKELAIFRPQSC